MTKEKIDPAGLEALSENFRRRGWDPNTPKAVSGWGEFHHTDRTFSVTITNKDGKETKVSLLTSGGTAPVEEPLYADISWGWDGHNLQIKAFPVSNILMTNDAYGKGNKEEGLVIVAPWQEFSFIIAKSGRVLIR